MKGKSILTNKIESEIELLERHVKMLNAIMEHEPIGIIRLSELLDIPQHKVRYSLRILEQEGLINPSPEGAVTTEKMQTFFADLKDILQHIDELLMRSVLRWKRKNTRQKRLINDQVCLANSYAVVAQSVERVTVNHKVSGSIPLDGANVPLF